VILEQFLKLLACIDVAKNTSSGHGYFQNSCRVAPDNHVESLINTQRQNLMEKICGNKHRVSASPPVNWNDNAARTDVPRQFVDCFGINQRVVDQKDCSGGATRRQGPDSSLNRRTHAPLVVWIENRGPQVERSLNHFLMVSNDNNGMFESRSADGIENTFKECRSLEAKERFGITHSFGFSGGEYDCGNQWDSA
jgi:hypothetical protein